MNADPYPQPWALPFLNVNCLFFANFTYVSLPPPLVRRLSFKPVLRILIRMVPERLSGSGSGIIVPDPAKSESACK